MADELDDFFAKKDKKKKSKPKPKFLTADELVKNLEDTTKPKTEPSIKITKKTEPIFSTTVGTGDECKPKEEFLNQEEEWAEFEEEQRKDYTGLKIGQLTLTDEDDDQSPLENDDDDMDNENGGDGENVKRSGEVPWKKLIPAEEVTQIPVEMPKKIYVSPALRQSQALTGSKGRNRAAPDITNADYFPTLSAARPEEQRKKKNEPAFEEVRHGGRMQRVQEKPITTVAAANRFQSLDNDS